MPVRMDPSRGRQRGPFRGRGNRFHQEQYEDDYSDCDSQELAARELQQERDTLLALHEMEAENRRIAAHGTRAENPTGNSKNAVSTADTVSSDVAMSSNAELRLYRMNDCAPTCPKVCTSCQPRWSNLPSLEAEKAQIEEMESRHGIVTRIDPMQNNKTVQVDIQNKHMKGILTKIFEGYPDFHPSLLPEYSAWAFNEPFDIFVSNWDSLRDYRLRTPFGAEKEALVALVAAMTPVIQPTLDSIKRIKDTGLVLWEDLPLIFPAGKLILVDQPGAVQSAARIQKGTSVQGFYTIVFEYIDWDGEIHGLNVGTLHFQQYAGYKKVKMSELKTMPLDFCPSEDELRAKLIARGRRWGSLVGVEYKQFGGKKVPLRTGVPIEVSACQRQFDLAYI